MEKLDFGRFGLYIVQALKGNIVSPFLVTLICGIFLGIIVLLLIDILKLKNKYFKVLLALLIAVTPNISVTLSFFYCSDAYILAMLFATLSVWLLDKYEKNKWIIVLSILLIAFSMSMYQTYIAVAMFLFIIVLILDLLNKKDIKYVIKKTFKYILVCILGIVLYVLLVKLSLFITGIPVSEYSGGNKLGIDVILQAPNHIKEAYADFYNYFISAKMISPSGMWHINLIHISMLIIFVVSLSYVTVKNKLYKQLPFIILLLVLLPIGCGIIELMIPTVDIHILMGCSYVLLFPFIFKAVELVNLEDKKVKQNIYNILKNFTIIFTVIMLWIYLLMDNASYLAMDKRQKQTVSCMNRIITQVEQLDEYHYGMPLLIVGLLEDNDYFKVTNSRFDEQVIEKYTWGFVSTGSLIWEGNNYSWERFFYEYMGINVKVYTEEYGKPLLETDEYKSMNVYPEKDSIKIINNVVIIKLK